jgi:hypothetical protein
MNEEFLKYGKQTVFGDLSKDGLLFRFLSEYNRKFGEKKHNLSCSTCREDIWNNYLNLFKMKKSNSEYVLKAKYNGIQDGFSGQPLRNGEITEAQALNLIKTHPKGKDLFEFIPEKVSEDTKEVKVAKKGTKKVKIQSIEVFSEEIQKEA